MDEETIRINEMCALARELGHVISLPGVTDVPELNSDGGMADNELPFAEEEADA